MGALRFLDSHSLVPIDDEAGGQARTWRICSQGRVNVRSEPLHEASRVKYVEAGEEFEATGPFRIQRANQKKLSREEWICLTSGAGYVCTTSSKDPGKLVAVLKRKRNSTHLKEPDVALIIKPEWCQQIFDNGKVWEIRGAGTGKRGRIAIAASGTGKLLGEATLVDSLPVGKCNSETNELEPYRNKKRYKRMFLGRKENMEKHRIKDLSIVTYPKVYAWVLDDATRYKTPVPYKHKQGAIIWVKLSENSQADVELMEEGANSDASSSLEESSCLSESDGEEQEKERKEEKTKEDAKEKKDATAAMSELGQLAKEANIKTVTPSPDTKKETPEKKEIPPAPMIGGAAAGVLQIPQAGTALMERLQWATSMLNSGLTEDTVVALLQCLLEATGDLGADPAQAVAALKESKAGIALLKLEKDASATTQVTSLAKRVRERWWSQARPKR